MKKFSNFHILIAISCFFSVLYFVSRLVNLSNLPIFTDEAIYIRWAQIAEQDSAWRFISLTDGKQPMLIWAGIIALKLINDPLVAMRFVSVISGFFGMIGLGLLARELFKNTRIGIFASLLYLVSPFTLMYDRMALMDSMLAMFSIWALYFSILLVRHLRLDIALILGMIIGGAVLTKTSGFFTIYLLPFTLFLFDFKNKKWRKNLLKWIGLVIIASIMSQVYYSVLRLSPWFHMISQKDTIFIYPFDEWLTHPFRFFLGNLHGLADWAIGYLTIPAVILVFIAVLFIFKKWREKLLLIAYFSAPFVALALFGQVLYPRFILFMVMPLLILAAWSLWFLFEKIETLKNHALYLLVSGSLIFFYSVYTDSKILFSIVTAPIPKSDSGQYINDHPAGWGIREVNDFLEKETRGKQIAVYTEGTFGLLPYGIEIYLVNNPNIKIVGVWPIPEMMSQEMLDSIASHPTYYISNKFQELPARWIAEPIAEYQKGNNSASKLRIYKLLGQKDTL
jgi:4-amino-4-deoxy-L-arabinose transferase-like glycosyltransferase